MMQHELEGLFESVFTVFFWLTVPLIFALMLATVGLIFGFVLRAWQDVARLWPRLGGPPRAAWSIAWAPVRFMNALQRGGQNLARALQRLGRRR